MEHIGIDLHKNQSQVCILTADAELIGSQQRSGPVRERGS